MRLGVNLGIHGAAANEMLGFIRHADAIGIDSIWAAEGYGTDAATVLAYLAGQTQRMRLGSAVFQIPARTPASAATAAMTVDALSGGRMVLGLGVSGPQVVEGWHGVRYGRPLLRTREYVDIVRAVVARERPLEYDGSEYQVPYKGPGATGLGKPLKSILRPLRPRIPIYLAAIGPKMVGLAAEIAEGWLPLFYSPEREDLYDGPLADGCKLGGRRLDSLDIAATVSVVVGDDLEACFDRLRPHLALYIGGMGSRERNFYHDLACRYGYQKAADRIQALYLEGKVAEAAHAVPSELIEEVALVGTMDRIIDRLEVWKASRVTTLILDTRDSELLVRLQDAL